MALTSQEKGSIMKQSFEEQSCTEWVVQLDQLAAGSAERTTGMLAMAEKRVSSRLPQLGDGHLYIVRSFAGFIVKRGTAEELIAELAAIRLGVTDNRVYRIWTANGVNT